MDEEIGGAPAEIEPDTKDWTWVIDRRCPECGVDVSRLSPAEVAASVRDLTPRWVGALNRPDAATRRSATTWSVLEYGCHVRDVHRLFRERLRLMLTEDSPTFANWDQDATALTGRYHEQEPAAVAAELAASATVMAQTLDAVREQELERLGLRSNGSRFTVATLARYYLHDVAHHTHDIGA